MTLYAETSAVLRWLLGAPRAAEVRALLARAERVYASRLTVVEARRALIRATAMGEIREAAALEAGAALSSAVSGWTLVEILPEVTRRAEERFPVEPIRTLDALHLATALFLIPELGPISMLSTDERIVKNALLLGLPLSLPVAK
jgi:predicted nucleic acid-binding protein